MATSRVLTAPATAPSETAPPRGAAIAGTRKTQPAADTSIVLSIQPDGDFSWQVTQKGMSRQFSNKSTYGEGMLTLVQDTGPALVGRVGWKDSSHITFQIVGDGPDDPGLQFAK
ncbi:MAG TPA: hypothetical protein VJY33_24365 [Isosphaeraceae bacterium]|nr:hypothetical protein [Isosphaeraceae bacterium]